MAVKSTDSKSGVAGAQLQRAPSGYDTTFVGRADDLEHLEEALRSAQAPVVLWGPAGVGKTRLAVEAVTALVDDGAFDGGVFCALNAANSREDIIAELALGLDAPIRSGDIDSAIEQLSRWLKHRRLLVVLDNVEQVLDATIEVAEQLAETSPSTVFLLTTRHAPHQQHLQTLAARPLNVADGVELLCARQPRLSEIDKQTLEAIVTRLDALPLSLELAAGRFPVFSASELLDHLDNQLETLQRLDERSLRWEATLHQSVDASWSLLSRAERSLLAQCTIFEGPFSLAGVEAVAELDGEPPANLLLQGLMRKSLLFAVEDAAGAHARFRLYESVREFACDRLDDSALDALKQRYVAYFAEQMQQGFQGLDSPHYAESVETMHVEFFDARRALEWLDYAHPDQVASLSRGLAQFVMLAAPFRNLEPTVRAALEWLERRDDTSSAQTDALIALALLESIPAHFERAIERAERAVRIATAAQLDAALAESEVLTGYLYMRTRQLDEAESHLRRAEDALERHHDDRLAGKMYHLAGMLSLERGDPDAAYEHFRQSAGLHRSIDNPRGEAQALANLGAVECARGRFSQARGFFEKDRQRWSKRGVKQMFAGATLFLGQCSLALGDLAQAHQALESARRDFESIGDQLYLAEILSWLGLYEAACGDVGEAVQYSDEAIGLIEAVGSDEYLVIYLSHRVIIEQIVGDQLLAGEYLRRATLLAQDCPCGPHEGIADLAGRVHELLSGESTSRDRPSLAAEAMAQHDVKLFAAVADGFLRGDFDPPALLGPSLEVDWPAVDWFELNGEHVDLSRRDAPRRILTRLVAHRLAHPGESLRKEELIDAGWPDEVLHPDAATSRIYTAIRQLRTLGLEDILLTRDGGYVLDPKVALVRSAHP